MPFPAVAQGRRHRLTLTRATHVLHYDRWWNPAVKDQATDRAYRIGQDRPVQVHRLIAEGTVEDKIKALPEKKRDLADAVIGSGERWIAELSDSELADLVGLRGTPSRERPRILEPHLVGRRVGGRSSSRHLSQTACRGPTD